MTLGTWSHATKHALEKRDCLRLEVTTFNIDGIIIEDGIIATNFGNFVKEHIRRKP